MATLIKQLEDNQREIELQRIEIKRLKETQTMLIASKPPGNLMKV